MLDNNDKEVMIGDSVRVFENLNIRSFIGYVVGFRCDGEITTVEDSQGDCFDLESFEFEKES